MKSQYKRKRKATMEESEGGEGSDRTTARVDEESSSGRASSGDRAGGSCGPRTGKIAVVKGRRHVWMLGRTRVGRWR